MTLPRSLRVLFVGAAAAAVLAAPAFADDEPAPRRVRIKLEREDLPAQGESAPTQGKDPGAVIERWMHDRMAAAAGASQGVDPLQAMLAQWFAAGDDVPMADLRDALKAEGIDARAMHTWLRGELVRGGAMAMRLLASLRGQPGMAQTFPWQGQVDEAPGMRPGPGRRGPWARGGMGPWGRGPHGMGPGGMMGPWGMGGGGMGPGGMGPGGMGPRGRMGPGAGGPRVHTEHRAFILWHDGTRWHRQALPQGPGMGPQGMPPHGMGPQAGPRRRLPDAPPPVRPPHGRKPAGAAQDAAAKALETLEALLEDLGTDGRAHDVQDLQNMLKVLEQLESQLQAPAGPQGKPGRTMDVRRFRVGPGGTIEIEKGEVELKPAPEKKSEPKAAPADDTDDR